VTGQLSDDTIAWILEPLVGASEDPGHLVGDLLEEQVLVLDPPGAHRPGFVPRCACGEPAVIRALQPGFVDHGHVSDWLWTCSDHHEAMRRYFGETDEGEAEPVEEVAPPPSAVARLRQLRPDLLPREGSW